MTCIVGIEGVREVFLGADSVSSDGHRKATRPSPDKIITIGGGAGDLRLAAAICGSWRMRDVMKHHLKVDPPRMGSEQDVNDWIAQEFIASLRKALKKHGCLQVNDGVERIADRGSFILAAGARLFQVFEYFQLAEVEPWGAADGSGVDIARAVLYDRSRRPDPGLAPVRLRAALEAAEELITTVRRPFHIFRFSGGELERVKEST